METSTKESLFISYCWSDGNTYADELEEQLVDYFDVRRDKSQLITNDDLIDYMATIAECDNVLIVLTEKYVKSINCMREVSYLLGQPDWMKKLMVLVIDETIYDTKRKIEILNYWNVKEKEAADYLNESSIGKKILEDDSNIMKEICSQLENFLFGITRRKNPTQIAVVNELVRRKNNTKPEQIEGKINDTEQAVKALIEKYGNVSISRISEDLSISKAYTSRLLKRMQDKNVISSSGTDTAKQYVIKQNQGGACGK